MILSRGVQGALIAAFCGILLVVYAIAWRAPAVGLFHDDGVYLVTAESIVSGHGYTIDSLPEPIPQTKYPPGWPTALALFLLVSKETQWLKALPLLCTAGWLVVTWRLLRKMGAEWGSAWLLVLITAASPMVVFLGTNLMSEPLFALLTAAALLMLLDDRALMAGILAGLATLTRSAGVPLIAACMLVFLVRRRFRSAAVFTGAAMVVAAPWLGWALAHSSSHPYYSGAAYTSTSILTSLQLSEKMAVFGANALMLFSSPFVLLSGIGSLYATAITFVLTIWALKRRRRLMPDLFVALYCLMLLCWAGPPQRFVAPILPLVLWILWRAFRNVKAREFIAAAVMLLPAVSVWADVQRLRQTVAHGQFPSSSAIPSDWGELTRLFAYIRANTPPDAVILTNLDPMFYLHTGRKAVRGFFPDGYKLYYAASNSVITPDQLGKAIIENGVTYVALTPDRDFAESRAYHRAVEALARGGVLAPVGVEGLSGEYQLFKVGSPPRSGIHGLQILPAAAPQTS